MRVRKPVLIVLGEPNSVFIEILAKTLNKNNIKKKIDYPIIIIGSKELIFKQLKILKQKLLFETLDKKNINKKLKNKVYLIDINYEFSKAFEKISNKSKKYINKCFFEAFKLLKLNLSKIIINGPISKKHFLSKKFPGVTEYVFENSWKKLLDSKIP